MTLLSLSNIGVSFGATERGLTRDIDSLREALGIKRSFAKPSCFMKS